MKVRIRLKRKILKGLGKRIKKLRLSKGLTQEILADKASIDTSYIAGIEAGRRSPSIYCLYQIATALESSLKEIADFSIEE